MSTVSRAISNHKNKILKYKADKRTVIDLPTLKYLQMIILTRLN